MVDYVYSIISDFPGSNVNLTTLRDQIEETVTPAAIVPVLVSLYLFGDSVTATFDATLSPDETTALNSVVAAHSGSSISTSMLARYLSERHASVDDISTINYKSSLNQALHRKVVTRPAGEFRHIEYYEDDTITDLVLDVRIAYSRDAVNGLALYRWVQRRWFAEDGSVFQEKWSFKRYDHDLIEQQGEGEVRRENVERNLKLTTFGILISIYGNAAAAENVGIPYFEKHSDDISNYIAVGNITTLITAITNDTDTWLDTDMGGATARDMMLAQLVEIVNVSDETWTQTVLAGPPS